MPRLQIEVARRESEPDSEPLVVNYLGEDFTCRPDINQFSVMELLASDANDIAAVMSSFMRFVQEMLIPDDWDRFKNTCRANNVGFEELQPLIQGIVEYWSARPTKQSPASSDGRLPTTTSSRPAYSLPDRVRTG